MTDRTSSDQRAASKQLSGWIAAGAALAALGIVLGAFGAHFLQTRIDERSQQIFEVGVRYQMYNAFGLVTAGLLASGSSAMARWSQRAGWLFCGGTCIFSGCLYLLAITQVKILGAIVPIGGLGMIAAWLSLLMGSLATRKAG